MGRYQRAWFSTIYLYYRTMSKSIKDPFTSSLVKVVTNVRARAGTRFPSLPAQRNTFAQLLLVQSHQVTCFLFACPVSVSANGRGPWAVRWCVVYHTDVEVIWCHQCGPKTSCVSSLVKMWMCLRHVAPTFCERTQSNTIASTLVGSQGERIRATPGSSSFGILKCGRYFLRRARFLAMIRSDRIPAGQSVARPSWLSNRTGARNGDGGRWATPSSPRTFGLGQADQEHARSLLERRVCL